MKKILLMMLFVALSCGITHAALFESGTKDAQPAVLYGKYNDTLVPIKVSADGTVGASGSGSISGLTGDATATVNVKEQGYFDAVFNYDGVSTYTDNTNKAKTTYGTAFGVFASTSTILYLGKSTPFSGISGLPKVYFTSDNALIIKYYNGSTFTSLTNVDNTNNFQNAGTITFTAPGNWAKTDVNGNNLYWVSIQMTSIPNTFGTLYSIRPGANSTFTVFTGNADTSPVLEVKDGKVFENGVSIASPTTFIVSSSTSRGSKNADFVCTGTKDSVCIQKAITACGSSPCKIVFLEGTYNLTTSINQTLSNVTYEGMGMGLTIFKISNTPVPVFADSTATQANPHVNVHYRNFEIDRSADTKDGNITRKGISEPWCKYCSAEYIYVHDSGATAIAFDHGQGNTISNCLLINTGTSGTSTGNSGIGNGTGQYASEPQVVTNNVIINPGFSGILIEDQNIAGNQEAYHYILSNNIVIGGGYGYVLRGANGIILNGNISDGATNDSVIIQKYGGQEVNNININGNQLVNAGAYGVNVSNANSGGNGTFINISDNDLSGAVSGAINNSLVTPSNLTTWNNIGSTSNNIQADITISGHNLITDTTTGSKIGTGANQKIGFYGSTPIVQPSGNIITALTNIGLVATPSISQSDITSLVASGKTAIFSNSLTMAGTDSTVMTFPSTSASIARTDAAQTFVGTQTLAGGGLTLSGTSGTVTVNTSTGSFTNTGSATTTYGFTGTMNSLTSGGILSGTSSGNSFTGNLLNLQYSGTGSGNGAKINISNASATGIGLYILNSGTGPSLELSTASAHAGQATCWTTNGAIGYCTTGVGAGGGCTCTGL